MRDSPINYRLNRLFLLKIAILQIALNAPVLDFTI